MKRAFTLVELLIVILILALLAGLALSALSGAQEQARESRTKAIVAKIDALVGEKWDGYKTRSVPLSIAPGTDPLLSARVRLYAIRALQRMELPDRKSDVANGNALQITGVPGLANSSLQRGYLRKALGATGNNLATWTTTHEGAECLFLILDSIQDGEQRGTSYFTSAEIGDVDEDGMKEILDGWGNPIEFCRWAPGYAKEFGCVTDQSFTEPIASPDPFDPLNVDPRNCQQAMAAYGTIPASVANMNPADETYALRPLIFSAGPDKGYGLNVVGMLTYATTNPPNDPYYWQPPNIVGQPVVNSTEWQDNITNHYQSP